MIRFGGEDVATIRFLLEWRGFDRRQKAIMGALKDINHLAALMSQEMNSQHRQGITLDGEAGAKHVLKQNYEPIYRDLKPE